MFLDYFFLLLWKNDKKEKKERILLHMFPYILEESKNLSDVYNFSICCDKLTRMISCFDCLRLTQFKAMLPVYNSHKRQKTFRQISFLSMPANISFLSVNYTLEIWLNSSHNIIFITSKVPGTDLNFISCLELEIIRWVYCGIWDIYIKRTKVFCWYI